MVKRVKVPPGIRVLRAAAYCRVSNPTEEQYGSLQAQAAYSEKLISSEPNWELAGIYQEQASGRNHKGMLEFGHLMNACRKGEVDLIITKSVSRFGRNTLDVLVALEELKLLNIDVYFEIENIHLQSENGTLLLTIFAAAAQEVSEAKSANVKWGLRRGFESGTSKMINRPCYGYRQASNGELVIEPEEAKIVKLIFEWRATGCSLRNIAAKLKELNIKSPRGKDAWGVETLNKLLSNEKYTGEVMMQKTFVSDYFNGKQIKNMGQLAKYIVSNNHSAIISKQNFDIVQNI